MGEHESPVDPPRGDSAQSPESSGRFGADVIRQLAVCVAGCMFAGMAIWLLLLAPSPAAPPPWTGWAWRDVLLTAAAVYCLGGMAGFVWSILLYQRELRGGPPVHPQVRNLGAVAWWQASCLAAVYAFALAPYGLSTDVLPLGAASSDWLLSGLLFGLFSGPGLLGLVVIRSQRAGSPFRWQGAQVDFIVPRVGGQAGPGGAVAVMLLLVVVLGPVAEEMLFRGVVYPGLRNELGSWAAVPLSGLIFALFHRYAGWPTVVVTAAFGMGFALLAEGSGSLWPGAVAHILVNSKYLIAQLSDLREPVGQPLSVEPSAESLAEPGATADRDNP